MSHSQNSDERWIGRIAANVSGYNSLSVSIEREFTQGNWTFGPKLELLNPFGWISYKTENGVEQMNSQVRIYLARVEWHKSDKIGFGASPFWMLGPVPRKGYYLTPSSVWISYNISDKNQMEISATNSRDLLLQLSFRKQI